MLTTTKRIISEEESNNNRLYFNYYLRHSLRDSTVQFTNMIDEQTPFLGINVSHDVIVRANNQHNIFSHDAQLLLLVADIMSL